MADELVPHSDSWVERTFFTPLYGSHGAIDVIKWWESRRLTYNAWVGAAGMLTYGIALATGNFGPPPMLAVAYGIAANIFYSFGAPLDLLLRRVLGYRGGAVGPVLFRYGFFGSVGLTLLPIPIIIFGSVMRLIFG